MRSNKNNVCCCIDLANAFNKISRKSILEVLETEPSLSHLTGFAGLVLAPRAALWSGGEAWGESEEGVAQGDPKNEAFSCVGLQPSLVQLENDCKAGEGMAKGSYDDCYAVGPPEVVLPAVERF